MKSFIVILLALMSQLAIAQETRLLRNPAISSKHIAFVYAGDIWTANVDGSNPTRLTAFPGVETDPAFSPDGKSIAFTADYDGNTDVYTLPLEGGTPFRLTWHPGNDNVVGWTNDGTKVLFVSGRQNAPYQAPDHFWTVSLTGGFPEKFIVPRGIVGKFSPDGKRFAYQMIFPWENEFRNYRGGQNNPVRLIDLATLDVEKIPFDNSNDKDPVWLGNKVFFLSDRDFSMNVWSYDTNTRQLKQETFYKEFDCKNLEGEAGKLIFENGGYLFTLDANGGQPVQLHITINGDFPWMRPHWVKVKDYITSVGISPTGTRALFAARGDIFSAPAEKGDVRNLSNTQGSADREPSWSPDGKTIAWFSDESGEYQLFLADQYGKVSKKIKLDNPTFYYTPRWSPDSKYLSYADAGRTLYVMEIATKKVQIIDNEGFAHPQRIIYPAWSPDSKWIAYSKRLQNEFAAVFVWSVDQKKSFMVTDGYSYSNSPVWDRNGKYLYFLASIDYGLNIGWLDMSSYERPQSYSVYLAVLSKDSANPMAPESDEEKVGADLRSPTKNDDGANPKSTDKNDVGANLRSPKKKDAGTTPKSPDKKPVEVKIDFEGLSDRIIALDIPAKFFTGLETGEDGILFYSEGSLTEPGVTVSKYSLKDRKSTKLASGISYFSPSADGKKMLYANLTGQSYIVDAGAELKPDAKALNIADFQMNIDPAAEYTQMFREAWRYQRDYFYVKNVHGADLDWLWKTYSPWVASVRHRDDFNYLLDILGGETSIGHSFVGGGDFPAVIRVPVGLLGADYEIVNGFYRFKKIFNGESWNAGIKAPLRGPGLNVKPGDYLLAVNGKPLTGSVDVYSLFDQTAGKQTFLTVNSVPEMKGAREITVVPVASEGSLRQNDWVENNRRKVSELSGGKLAYVWLPNTSFEGYRNFNRYVIAQKDKKGIIIDERYNQGGSIGDYFTEFLSRQQIGYFNNPVGDKQPFTAPDAGIWGPKVMIINEMAGSGGDYLPYSFRVMKLGPLVGTRTWGGLVGIWDVPNLIDNGSITAPRGGFYNLDGEWAVENQGVAPDYEVEETPSLIAKGQDPQLEKAVQVAMELLKNQEVKLKPQPADPVRVKRPVR